MAGQLTIDTLKASSGVLATQNGMTGIAKAWVQWVGTTGAINASFNISSVTRTGTGVYTINFTTAMPDTYYSVVFGGARTTNPWPFLMFANSGSYTTSSFAVQTSDQSASQTDMALPSLAVFR